MITGFIADGEKDHNDKCIHPLGDSMTEDPYERYYLRGGVDLPASGCLGEDAG